MAVKNVTITIVNRPCVVTATGSCLPCSSNTHDVDYSWITDSADINYFLPPTIPEEIDALTQDFEENKDQYITEINQLINKY